MIYMFQYFSIMTVTWVIWNFFANVPAFLVGANGQYFSFTKCSAIQMPIDLRLVKLVLWKTMEEHSDIKL